MESTNTELPYCRRCGNKVQLDSSEDTEYAYECLTCDESLYSIETVFESNIVKRKPTKCKTLEKTMCYNEVEEFLSTRPHYRLPREGEVERYLEYIPNDRFFVVGTIISKGIIYPRTCEKVNDTLDLDYSSRLFKFKVFLIETDITIPTQSASIKIDYIKKHEDGVDYMITKQKVDIHDMRKILVANSNYSLITPEEISKYRKYLPEGAIFIHGYHTIADDIFPQSCVKDGNRLTVKLQPTGTAMHVFLVKSRT